MTTQDLLAHLQSATTKKYLNRYGIKHLRLFGSYAQGDFSKKSDIDLLYEYDTNTPYQARGAVKPLLYLQNKTRKKIDLVSKNTLDKAIAQEVLSHSIALW